MWHVVNVYFCDSNHSITNEYWFKKLYLLSQWALELWEHSQFERAYGDQEIHKSRDRSGVEIWTRVAPNTGKYGFIEDVGMGNQ